MAELHFVTYVNVVEDSGDFFGTAGKDVVVLKIPGVDVNDLEQNTLRSALASLGFSDMQIEEKVEDVCEELAKLKRSQEED